MRWKPNRFRKGFSGNALIEYALPASIVVIGAGLLASSMDISQLIGTYFASASGDTLTAGTHVTSSWGTRVTGAQGTGSISWSGASGSFGGSADGLGGAAGSTGQELVTSTGGNGGGGLNPFPAGSSASELWAMSNSSSTPEALRPIIQQMAYSEFGVSGGLTTKAGGATADGNAAIAASSTDLKVASAALAMEILNPANAAELASFGDASIAKIFGYADAANLHAHQGLNSEALLGEMASLIGGSTSGAQNSAYLQELASGANASGQGTMTQLAQQALASYLGVPVSELQSKGIMDAIAQGKSLTDVMAMANGMTAEQAATSMASASADCKSANVCLAAQNQLKQEALLALQSAQQASAATAAGSSTQAYTDFVANNPNATQAELDAAYNTALASYNQCTSYGGSCGTAPKPTVATITTVTATTQTPTTGTGL